MRKSFKTEDVLSVYTGRKLGDDIEGVMDHLFPGISWPYGASSAQPKAAEILLGQFPVLAMTNPCTGDNWKAWLLEQIKEFGETMEVEGPASGI